MLVFGAIRGSDGRLRRTVHPSLRYYVETQRIELFAPTASVGEDGILAEDPTTPDFDLWKFSRGLHRMALGAMALVHGADRALNSAYDAVRTYVKRPNDRRMRWFLQRINPNTPGHRTFRRLLRRRGRYFIALTDDPTSLVYMNFFTSEFIVALAGDVAGVEPWYADAIARGCGLPPSELPGASWLIEGAPLRGDTGDGAVVKCSPLELPIDFSDVVETGSAHGTISFPADDKKKGRRR